MTKLFASLAIALIAVQVLFAGAAFAATDNSYDHAHDLMFERYKPTYFIAGKDGIKGQLSFKIPVIENAGLYAGYSQLLIWHIYEPSGPVHDIDYNPEVFYRFHLGNQNFKAIDLGAFEHESNGLAGANSRAWNRTYLRWHEEFQKADSAFQIIWEAKVWYQYLDDPGNRDIQRYRGTYEANITLAGMGHTILNINDLTFRFFPGGPSTIDPTRGAQELEWRVMGPRKLLVPIFVQLYHGYAENLLDYKHKQWMLRAGFGF